MVGSNLSQLGIDAGGLDNGLNTWSTALIWMPATGEVGNGRFGDFDNHQKLATRLAGHFTRSKENSQSQPQSDNFDNVQIRLSDGSVVFQPGPFGPGTNVTDVTYNMADADAVIKYHGFSLDDEYYQRWLNDFRGPGTLGLPSVKDKGYQVQAAAMVVPKTLQVYVANSMIFGRNGNPWDARVGVKWFPWKTEGIRGSIEYIQLHRSR
jgi:hypothetical protein